MSSVVASRRAFSPARLLTFLVANLVWLAPLCLLPATSAAAATDTFTVGTATDDIAGIAANCPVNNAGGSATCSLRDAITAANADVTVNSIVVDLTGLGNAVIQLTSALPAITQSMTLQGNLTQPGLLTVFGTATNGAFGIQTGSVANTTVVLEGFTIANGGGGYTNIGYGSGLFIYNPPVGAFNLTVDVTNMIFSGNAANQGGAAITADGIGDPVTNGITLNVVGSSFNGNTSLSNGGAIWNGGALNVSSSTFSSNAAPQGAGIYNCDDASCGPPAFGSVTVSDSTFANNSNPVGGGTIYNASTAGVLTVYDSTFYGNTGGSSPASTGGSIANFGTTFSVTNSVFANPTPSGNECTGVTVLVGTGCPASPQTTADVNGDLQDTAANLKLSSLSNFGGLTATLVPGTGSAAICGGTAPAKNVDGSQLTTDQRGFPTDPNCGVNVDSGSVQVGSNTITVTTTTDDAGTPAGNAANCPGVACSLRDAIAKANGLGSANIDATGISGTIALGAKLPLSTGNTTIAGPGAGNLTVDGGAIPGGDAILENTAGSLTVSDMTFANAAHTGNGGGLIDAATMSLTRVTLKHNSSTGDGGGVYSTGTSTLTVDQSTFTNNTATGGGGGIESASGALTVTNSTFSGNSTAGNGSAIDDTGSSTPTIDYSTFSGNNATGGTGGGAIALYSGGAITITNATFAGNANAGGPDDTGIFNSGGALTVKNSLLDVALECSVGTGCPTNGTNGNIVAPTNSNAGMTGMSALGSYGGATQTILPEPGSNAICGGLLASIPSGFTTDQRGLSNATPGGYGVANCSDAGSVQTNYTAVGFNAPSYTASVNIAGATPQVIASVTENGQNVGGIPLTLTTGGAAGTPTGTTATTVGGTGATFSALTFPATGIGTVEETFTVVGADVLTAGPLNVTVGAAGNVATTTTEATPAPASFVVSVTATNVTLAATVVHTATPVTEG